MNGFDTIHNEKRILLASQLRLLEERKADVTDLLKLGGDRDEVLVDAIANDLVGARLVFRAALTGLFPTVIASEERDTLREREREARNLLRVVLNAQSRGQQRKGRRSAKKPL